MSYRLLCRDSDTRVVFFAASIGRRKRAAPPFFHCITIGPRLKASTLNRDDPSLAIHPELGLAWYAGAKAMRRGHRRHIATCRRGWSRAGISTRLH
ncbi:MAG: hypothetical protein Q4G25_14250 [Paracoccus sp. (in: a-proteobacteria)]|nr:hypothetical protein [Paracoccus sp. (in: a-proteobacteria)]